MVIQLTIDSSVLIAALRKTEEKHSESLKLLQQVRNGQYTAIEPYSVLVEIVAAIRRRTDNQTLAEKVKEDFLNIENLIFVDIDSTLSENAANTAAKISVRGMDAIVIQTAIEYNASLVSLDKEMLKKARSVVEIKEL